MFYRPIKVLLAGLVCVIFSACSSPQMGFFNKKSPHELYADRLERAGLKNSALGISWLKAAEKALTTPVQISLPYKETGYFSAETPSAAGYLFDLQRGEFLKVAVEKTPVTGFYLFIDLWDKTENEPARYLSSADTATLSLQFEVKKSGSYILRIQPELLSNGSYTLTMTTGPSLAFPVPANANPRIASIWGDQRDAGKRKHEGVDIFAKFRTPAIAAADGYVTSVRTGGLGGKVVFMRPDQKDYVLYYAHLDSQFAREGQRVLTGDTLGLIGNTGNARSTPPHLHFGIYTNGGAIDPYPFIHRNSRQLSAVKADTAVLNQFVRIRSQSPLLQMPESRATSIKTLPRNMMVRVESAVSDYYRISLPDGSGGFVRDKDLAFSDKPVAGLAADSAVILYAQPSKSAAPKAEINAGAKMQVIGYFGDYKFIKYHNLSGWIKD